MEEYHDIKYDRSLAPLLQVSNQNNPTNEEIKPLLSDERGKTAQQLLHTTCHVSFKYFDNKCFRLRVKHTFCVTVALPLYVVQESDLTIRTYSSKVCKFQGPILNKGSVTPNSDVHTVHMLSSEAS